MRRPHLIHAKIQQFHIANAKFVIYTPTPLTFLIFSNPLTDNELNDCWNAMLKCSLILVLECLTKPLPNVNWQ